MTGWFQKAIQQSPGCDRMVPVLYMLLHPRRGRAVGHCLYLAQLYTGLRQGCVTINDSDRAEHRRERSVADSDRADNWALEGKEPCQLR